MNGEGSTSRQRPTRTRRPPRNAYSLSSTTFDPDEMTIDNDSMPHLSNLSEQHHKSADDRDTGAAVQQDGDEEGQDSSAWEDDESDGSDDEYRPAGQQRKQRKRKQRRQNRQIQGRFASLASATDDDGSDEEFEISPSGSEAEDQTVSEDGSFDSNDGESDSGESVSGESQGSTGNIDPELLAESDSITNTAMPARHVQPGYGGLEDFDTWQAIGEQRRQMHQHSGAPDSQEADVEQDELQDLANAFSAVDTGISNDTVGRWQSALHADADIDEKMDEEGFDQDLRIATGFRRKTLRDEHGKARQAPRERKVSPEVKRLLAEANVAYIENDLQLQVSKLTEVIRIDPAERSAWANMALYYHETGDVERELQCRIMEAHLTPYAIPLWVQLADNSYSRGEGYEEQTIYCLTKAINSSREKDRSDVLDIMWRKGQQLLYMDQLSRAAKVFLRMLDFRPQNQQIIEKVIETLGSLQMFDKAIEVLEGSAEWNMQTFPNPQLDIIKDAEQGVGITYTTNEILTLADLYLMLERPWDAINTIRKGQRWLQGRASETFWDEMHDDDREFDTLDMRESRKGNYGLEINKASKGQPHHLDDMLRLRLGMARARLGYVSEMRNHFNVFRDFVEDDFEMHLEPIGGMIDEYIRLANELSEEEDSGENNGKQLLNEALGLALRLVEVRYEEQGQLQESDEYIDRELICAYVRVADCYMGLGQHDVSISYLKEVVDSEPTDLENKLKLAEAYGVIDDHQKAVALIREVMEAKRELQHAEALSHGQQESEAQQRDDETLTQSLSLFAEISQREASNKAKRKSATSGTYEEALRLEAMNEAYALQMYRRAKSIEKDVFVDRWWHHDCLLAGDPSTRIYGVHESIGTRKARFDAVSDWLNNTERLVSMFTDTPQLYPRDKSKKFSGLFRRHHKRGDRLDRQARALLARIGRVMIDDRIILKDFEKSTFRGITLHEWIDLLMQYAFILTKVGEFDDAQSVLLRALKSNVVWTDVERSQSLSLCLASCALYASQWDVVMSELALRSLPAKSQFQIEPLRILGVISNGGGRAGHQALSSPNNQKFFLRRSRISEALVQGCPTVFNFAARRWVARVKLFETSGMDSDDDEGLHASDEENQMPEREQEQQVEERESDEEVESEEEQGTRSRIRHASLDEDEDGAPTAAKRKKKDAKKKQKQKQKRKSIMPQKTKQGDAQTVWAEMQKYIESGVVNGLFDDQYRPPKQHNPANDAFYAGLLLTSSNGIPSMAYWLRSFAQFQNDALICLGCAIACLGRATNRQVDNRHLVITEAFAFLDQYRAIRRKNRQYLLHENNNGSNDNNVAFEDEAEVAYNIGRAAHRMGLMQIAMEQYKIVLDKDTDTVARMDLDKDGHLSSTRSGSVYTPSFDCVAEAAFNLHLLYIYSGNTALANAIVKRYLRV